ncbi:MAG: aminoglycoside phosphotransferase family protein [candidate division KSB1 bacterium]|nr:aminoglycoside phosphotransferase family protein [candidate division KSB1 bacterium]MDZ7368191.1 aminoglycoside phosphotransferase family protein [candidate division KSB1 bacterium]MDZ7405918.1 aminoglycoside phosphotransferase family protein [candidate division KSB1 bacterium]
MTFTKPRHDIGEQFHELYRRLSRPQANALLDDCIYELPAAWKFLTALRYDLPILIVLHGFSSVPLAFARNSRRVDILGFNQYEADLFHELARFKNLANYHICGGRSEICGPYGLMVWLPTRRAVDENREDEWMAQAMAHLHPQGELWFVHCFKPDWHNPLNRLRRLLWYLRSSEQESLPTAIRLLMLAEPIPHQTVLETFLAKIAATANGRHQARQINHLGIIPHWATPVQIAPLPPLRARQVESANQPLLRILEQKKFAETHHALAHLGSAAVPSFVSRLLDTLARRDPGSCFQMKNYRILAGGKVQIDARWKKKTCEQSVFIKLPLVPFAAGRLRKQSEILHDLQHRDGWRCFDATTLSFSPTKAFPQILAQGEFEKQMYFLESRVKGTPLGRLEVPNGKFRQVCDTLFSFWHEVQTQCGQVVEIDHGKFDQIFRQPLRQLIDWAQLRRPYDAILCRLEDFFAEQFSGQRLFLGLVHGDFSTKNILAHPKTFALSGIIDWDMAVRESFPVLDVLHFFVRLDPGSFQQAPPQIAMRLIKEDSRDFHWPYLQQALAKFEYEKKFLPAFVACYWAQRLQVYLDSPKYLDSQFRQRHVYDVLDFFAETILRK